MFFKTFTTQSGLKLAADVGGDPSDPAVLLLHGARENRHAWSQAARELVGAGRYVVSLDLRGHGDSDWAPDHDYSMDAYAGDVRDVVAQLPSRPAIVGFLLGGFVALTLAGEDRDQSLSGLVLLDTTLEIDPPGDGSSPASIFARTAEAGFASVDEAVEAVSAQRPFRARIGSASGLRRNLRHCEDGRWRWNCDPESLNPSNTRRVTLAGERERLETAARRVTAPVLIAHGGERSLVSASQLEHLTGLLPQAEVADLTGARDLGEAFDASLVGFLERVARRPDDRPALGGVDPLTMRRAFGNFGTGVTVITTAGPDGQPIGFTANSFTSVSLTPPMVLFCLDHRSSSMAAFEAHDAFAVNVLHIGQQDVSDRFMSKTADRWRDTGWETWDTGVPILQDAMACFECDKEQSFDAGDHRIYIGRVRRVWFDPSRDPLLYLQGAYRRVHIPH